MNQPLVLWKLIAILVGFAIGIVSILESKESSRAKESELIARIYDLEKRMNALMGVDF